jgi:membrane carboxypeptidase/penicillin-binding protein PbpC
MKRSLVLKIVGLCIFLFLVMTWILHREITLLYRDTISVEIIDRHGESILIQPNNKGYLTIPTTKVTPHFRELLLLKEDRYFPYHPGINPTSMIRAVLTKLGIGHREGSSTITQQFTKLILRTENERTVGNKIIESAAAVITELYEPKEQILLEYANSVYLGNQIQGIETASRAYFGISSDKLSTEQILQLLVTLNNPSYSNPLLDSNVAKASGLANLLGVTVDKEGFITPETVAENLNSFRNQHRSFELKPWLETDIDHEKQVQVSLDITLNDRIREAIVSIMPNLYKRDAHDAAVVVLDAHSGEVLALVGSPDPTSLEFGQQINMLTKPRQVASTIKPLLYARAFEAGMRPYTLIDDKEYPYTTADGRILYPRNFDGMYRGLVSADYALANSINVPAIKTLEFLGQDTFKDFVTKLGYPTPEKVTEHQLGSALGTIDMTLVDLTHYYSIFPNQGELLPVRLFSDASLNAHFFSQKKVRVIDPQYTQLITKILSDRYLGIDQFGYTSGLSLPIDSYALKTGTSDDYRDTWVIGYTPDFIVGVWVGNTDNTPTDRLSGQTGAGEIWSRVMQILSDTKYNLHGTFSYDRIRKVSIDGKESYGLPGDDAATIRRLLLDGKVSR